MQQYSISIGPKYRLIALTLVGFGAAAPQAVPEITAALFGRVVNAQTGEPVRRAAIKIYSGKTQWDALTDGAGRFKFPPIERGQYDLVAHRDGFTDRYYIVERSDFDDPKELPIELLPQGVVTGKVVDGFGQPLQEARVEALPSPSPSGQASAASSAETNDLGEYRVSGLDPGRYRIRATYTDGKSSEFDATPLTMASSFFGGSEKPAELVVKAGSISSGIDFVLNPVRGSTIRGTLHTDTGTIVDSAGLWIMGKEGEGGHNGNADRGEFEFKDLNPGTYVISAETLDEAMRPLLPTDDASGIRLPEARRDRTAPLFGAVTVQVHGEDVAGIDVLMHPVPKIEGQVRLIGGDVSSKKLGMISFHRVDRISGLGLGLAEPRSDGTFEVFLPPGQYLFVPDTTLSKLGVEQVMFNGRPITDWKLTVDSSAEPKKLVFVLSGERRP